MNFDFSNIKVLLIGDFMIDHYIIGISKRISPEAPVPVIIPKNEFSIPGGAGNVAMNLSSMGAKVSCIGSVGSDNWGEQLIEILDNKGIQTEGIKIFNNHPTTLKTRVYLGKKQVARIDKEEELDFDENPEINSNYDIIILSDYNKGVLNNIWFDMKNKNIIVDPKKDSFSHYEGAKIITPNIIELQQASGIIINSNESIINASKKLIHKYDFEYIIAKKGHKGITVVGKDGYLKNIAPYQVFNADVTGAGDTVIAALSIAYAKTGDIEFSAKFANAAAAVVVGKTGTSIPSIKEIEEILII